MTALDFGVLPPGIIITPTPLVFHFPQPDLDRLSSLVQTALIGAPSYYNTHNSTDDPNLNFGPSRDWLSAAADIWTNEFNWRAHEDHWNTIPQFTINVTVPSDNQIFNLHFAALFSRCEDATPLILSHGWPSSWIDFVSFLELLMQKYTPETLPYHVIVPSIPDFGLSTRSNVTETELDYWKASEALNELMKALGFNAYVAQGGDVGSGLTAALGLAHDECKAVHFNNFITTPQERTAILSHSPPLPLTPSENASLTSTTSFFTTGTGYLIEQGTRPSTLALALESSPVALLAWLGSMYTDISTHTFDSILQQVSWYWLTRSFGRGLWAYRTTWDAVLDGVGVERLPSAVRLGGMGKPVGYSAFAGEVLFNPRSWVEEWFGEDLMFWRGHGSGGHFAVFEEPEEFLRDIEDFVVIVRTKVEF